MRILIRVDASLSLGTFQVRRMLALAEELESRGAQVVFASSRLPGNQIALTESRGFRVMVLNARGFGTDFRLNDEPEDAEEIVTLVAGATFDLIIVDHYFLGSLWEKKMKKITEKIMAVDDLANRTHSCDVLVDANNYGDRKLRYRNLVPPDCEQLLGTDFALVGREFLSLGGRAEPRPRIPRKIISYFGEVDSSDETGKLIRAVEGVGEISLQAVVGADSRWAQESSRIEIGRNVEIINNAMDLPRLMGMADLMFCSDFQWERFYLGLPGIVTIALESQSQSAEENERRGCHRIAGYSWEVDPFSLRHWLIHFVERPALLQAFSWKAGQTVDGRGARRLAARILGASE